MATSACTALLAALVFIAAAEAGFITHYPTSSTVANKFLVKWSAVPGDLFPSLGFFEMPRTSTAAQQDGFKMALDRTEIDKTTVWCRNGDYRVCVLFDLKGSVAGMMVSGAVKELATSPYEITKEPQWFRQTVLGEDVYSTIAYFIDSETLAAGGRILLDSTPTAPRGIRVLETKNSASSLLVVNSNESLAPYQKFTKQNCFIGMGQHYFHELSPSTKCENVRPYFLLFGKRTQMLLGFGILQWGKVTTTDRAWFEQPPVPAIQMIAGSRPACLTDWVDKYTLNTIHVFFVPNPWETSCASLF